MGALPGFPPFIVFALAGAAWFTRCYPARVRARAAVLAAHSRSTSGQPTTKANA